MSKSNSGETLSEKKLNNTIFLMYLVTENFRKKHNMSIDDFLALDSKCAILNYVAECPGIFDSMTNDEMIEEIEAYICSE